MFSKGMIWLDQSSRPVALRPMSRELTITARAQGHDIVILIDRHGREVLTLRRGEVPGMEK